MNSDSRILKILTSVTARDGYCAAVLHLLSRVEITEGDIVIEKQLKPLYELLDIMQAAQPTCSEGQGDG